MNPSKVRANEVERTPNGNDLFYTGHLQHERERSDMERKYMNSDKAKEKSPSQLSEVGPWVAAQIQKASSRSPI